LNELERTLGLRKIANNRAHTLTVDIPLAVVHMISWIKNILSELFTILLAFLLSFKQIILYTLTKKVRVRAGQMKDNLDGKTN